MISQLGDLTMSNDNEEKEIKPVIKEDKPELGFGITEAPKDCPGNENGNLKVIMG